MVRPCNEERDLQRLHQHPELMIQEFENELNRIRDKIYHNCGAKQICGMNMSSRMYITMVENFVNSINGGDVPNIQNA